MSDLDESVPPVVCTLTVANRAHRQLEWADVGSVAQSRRTLDTGVVLTFPLSLSDQVRDLAAREMQCCGSWLNIEHRQTQAHVELTLTTVSPEGLLLIRQMSS